jgi:hypothetical protein
MKPPGTGGYRIEGTPVAERGDELPDFRAGSLRKLNMSKKLLTMVPCAFTLSIEHVQNTSNDDFNQESRSHLRPDS